MSRPVKGSPAVIFIRCGRHSSLFQLFFLLFFYLELIHMNKKQQKGEKKSKSNDFAPFLHDQDEAVVNRFLLRQHSIFYLRPQKTKD